MKADKIIDKAEEEQIEVRKNIKALSRKFDLDLKSVRNSYGADADEFADESVKDAIIPYAGEGVVSYIPRLASSLNRTATKKIFPHNIDNADRE